ncbi:MAG: hypothetical protein WBA57_14260 [Elainellaceae cyanobacterium]
MTVTAGLFLTSDDIRYLRASQLSVLTGINATSFPRWDHGGRISERSLERIANGLWMTKQDVLCGFELRRHDVTRARAIQNKVDQFIALLQTTQAST